MSSIAGVVFDLGGVLIDWDPMYLYREVFGGDESRAREFLTQVCTQEWNEMQDAGRTLEDATSERIALFPQWEPQIRAYYGRWIEMVRGRIPGTAAVLRELKALNLRLFALSNWSRETFPLVRHRFEELDLFEEIFLSGHFGCAKPDERFYRAALVRIGLEADRLVFIDDNLRNLDAAGRLGFRTLAFTDAAKLRRDLRALDVPIVPHA